MSTPSGREECQPRDEPAQGTALPARPPTEKRKRSDSVGSLEPQPVVAASAMDTPAHVQRQPTAEKQQLAPAARTPSLPTPPAAVVARVQRSQGPRRWHEDECAGDNAHLGGHPELQPGDEEFFGALEVEEAERELAPEAAKERRLLRLLLHLKNGERPQYKSALKQLTESAREFGVHLLVGKMLPMLQSALLGEAERRRLVKALDRALFKIKELLPKKRMPASKLRRRFASALDPRPWTLLETELVVDPQPLGRGSYSEVHLADWHGTMVVFKKFLRSRGRSCVGHDSQPLDTALARAEEEASLLALLRHPNVVPFLGLCRSPPAVVMEYCARGSLCDVLKAARSDPALAAELSWQRRLNLALDLACGMAYLHTRPAPVVHRDLKSPNCFVAADWRLKVGDLNLSKVLENGEASSDGEAVMNSRWLGPEVTSGGPATLAADVYSGSMVLWELLTWQLPWAGENNTWEIARQIRIGERPPVPPLEELPGPAAASVPGLNAYIALMRRCWDPRAEARPSFVEVAAELRKLLKEEDQAAQQPTAVPARREELEAAAGAALDCGAQRVSNDEDAPARPAKRARAAPSPTHTRQACGWLHQLC